MPEVNDNIPHVAGADETAEPSAGGRSGEATAEATGAAP